MLKDGRRWVMFFFGYNYKAAQEGIAISENLLDWTKYPEPIITAGQEGELDFSFAHKPAVISHEGILYHFYTACAAEGRRPDLQYLAGIPHDHGGCFPTAH